LIEDSLRVVDAVLRVETPHGPCWRRYNHDGYGPKEDGSAYDGWGIGRAWPLLTGERGHYELAAGRDVRPFILAFERFATRGGMLPEQVWDGPDLPEARMYLGRPAGSAMPLMWAHAEYIKLLRSTADRKIWDLVDPVAERYLNANGRKDIEIWKPNRRVRRVDREQVLRIQAPERFRLHWTLNEWERTEDTDSKESGIGIFYLDIPVPGKQKTPIEFTFYWPDRDEWEGQDYTVEIAN
jgi:glucoamylase